MFKKTMSLLLINALLLALSPAAFAGVNKEAKRTEQVKAGLAELGAGPASQVELKLRDRRKLTGFIASLEAETFTLTEAASRAEINLRYDDVAQVKGRSLASGKKIAIGVGIGVGVLLVVAIIALQAWPDGTD
ncbi:MAG: hypothetical protein HOP19_04370 [Acidobacteria bacterium]|nr:hypothetical protein [Acidobacteriota bacterium]